MSDLVSAALAVMLALSPISAPHERLPWTLDDGTLAPVETPEAREARYASIAADVASAVEEACSAHDQGPGCRRRWVNVALSIAYHETDFAPDVDRGRCYRGRDGRGPRCDSGRAKSMWQIQAGGEEGERYRTDRRAAVAQAIRLAVRSWNRCRSLEPALRWAAYAGGKCEEPMAQRRSREIDGIIYRAERAWPSD